MKNTAILSVVRALQVVPTEADFLASHLNADWYRDRYPEDKRREDFRRYIADHNTRTGFFVKSGGGKMTANMQEAQIFGWSRKAKENLNGYKAPYYEVIPVTIEVAV